MASATRTLDGERQGRTVVFWTAACTAASAATALAVGYTTPPRSGPNCRHDCIGYPYTGGAEFVPRDYWWMYPGCLTALLAVALVMALPHRDGAWAALAGRMAVVLAAISAGVLVTDYGIQLTVVQTGLAKGESAGLGWWSQYNPHGVFIALENVGYLLLGLALGAAGVAFAARSRVERVARWIFGIGGALTVVALAGFALAYRSDLEYRFEVAGIGIGWGVLIVAGVLLAVGARRDAPGHHR